MDESERYKFVCKQLDRIEGSIGKLFKIVAGNGDVGLVEKMARMDERLKVLQSWRKWAIGMATTITVGGIIAVARLLLW